MVIIQNHLELNETILLRILSQSKIENTFMEHLFCIKKSEKANLAAWVQHGFVINVKGSFYSQFTFIKVKIFSSR